MSVYACFYATSMLASMTHLWATMRGILLPAMNSLFMHSLSQEYFGFLRAACQLCPAMHKVIYEALSKASLGAAGQSPAAVHELGTVELPFTAPCIEGLRIAVSVESSPHPSTTLKVEFRTVMR
jgi:hypothetical protein